MPPYAKREIKNDGERKTTWQDKGHEKGDSPSGSTAIALFARLSYFSICFLFSLACACLPVRIEGTCIKTSTRKGCILEF